MIVTVTRTFRTINGAVFANRVGDGGSGQPEHHGRFGDVFAGVARENCCALLDLDVHEPLGDAETRGWVQASGQPCHLRHARCPDSRRRQGVFSREHMPS